MTIDDKYEVVTMWDVSKNKTVSLNNRIEKPELLKMYLSNNESNSYLIND